MEKCKICEENKNIIGYRCLICGRATFYKENYDEEHKALVEADFKTSHINIHRIPNEKVMDSFLTLRN